MARGYGKIGQNKSYIKSGAAILNLANDDKHEVLKGTVVEETAMNESWRDPARHAIMLKGLLEKAL